MSSKPLKARLLVLWLAIDRRFRRLVDRARAVLAKFSGCRRNEIDRVRELHLEAVVEQLQQGLLMFDEQGEITVCNTRFKELCGVREELELSGSNIHCFLDLSYINDELTDAYSCDHIELMMEVIENHEVVDLIIGLKNGRTVQFVYRPMQSGGGVLSLIDITERVETEARMRHLALHDGLTGLANRMSFDEQFEKRVRDTADGSPPFCLLYLDLNLFKQVNDTIGHAAGDEVLCRVAERLQSLVGPYDLIARQGGDEFALIARSVRKKNEARRLAYSIIRLIEQPMMIFGHRISVGVSIGILLVDSRSAALPLPKLFEKADTALYDAKSTGWSTYRFASDQNALVEGVCTPSVRHDSLPPATPPQSRLRNVS